MKQSLPRTLFVSSVASFAFIASLGGCGAAPPVDMPDPGNPNGGGDTAGADGSSGETDELIVTLMPGADPDDVEALFSDLGATVSDRLDALSAVLLSVDRTQRDAVADALGDSPLVEDVGDNSVLDAPPTPSDTIFAAQWHLEAIDAAGAWAVTTGSTRVPIAIVDTGVQGDHVDLATRLVGGGNTHDGGEWQDAAGHGTEVAGVIGAVSDNDEGVTGVTWSNPLIPIRVTGDDGRATSWSLAAGIGLAVNEGAKVVNVSFAPLHDDTIVLRQAALARLSGALVVFASGNDGLRVEGGGSDSALFVGATDRNGDLATFSTHGPFVDLVAPGVSIYTTKMGDSYGSVSGTSLAAPIVSGVAALVWSANTALQPATVRGILRSTATDLGSAGDDDQFGAGQVNAGAAVELALAIEEQADNAAPLIEFASPSANVEIRGAIAVEIDVSDDSDLSDVTLRVDGIALASDSIAPYAFVLDAARYSRGAHTVTAVATDVFGNAAERSITLNFAGPADVTRPAVEIVSPLDRATVRGTVTIVADVSDNQAVAHAQVRVDDAAVGTLTLSGSETRVAFNWNTTGGSDGERTLTIRVLDSAGNSAEASIRVTVENQ
jgi:subtilisin family serine protease